MKFLFLQSIFILSQINPCNCKFQITLPENYQEFKAPTNASGGPINVKFTFKELKINEVSSTDRSIKISMKMALKWIDDRIEVSDNGQNQPVRL